MLCCCCWRHIGLLFGKRLGTNLLRHRIRKYSDSPVHTLSESLRIYFFPLWKADLNIPGFTVKFFGCVWTVTVSGKKVADSKISGYVWTGPQLQVLSHLNKLCTRKVTVLDSVSAILLRECPDLIFGFLPPIFNQSIDTGISPDEWKSARITPLFMETGSRSDSSNYRPMLIIPVVAKVFEKIIYDHLYHYLNENDLLSRHQSATLFAVSQKRK